MRNLAEFSLGSIRINADHKAPDRYSVGSMFDRFEMRPGMTGLWQVSGRSSLSFLRGMALDVAYVRKWLLLMDLAIIAKTIPAVLSRKGAW